MFCHVPPGHAPLRLPCGGSVVRILHTVPPSRFAPFAPPPACLRRDPIFARNAWAHAPAFAPARFARLIARASQAQGALLPSVPVGGFSRRARGGRRSGLRMPLPPVPSYHSFTEVKPLPELFIIHEQIVAAERTSCKISCFVMRCHRRPAAGRTHLARPFPKTASPNSLPRYFRCQARAVRGNSGAVSPPAVRTMRPCPPALTRALSGRCASVAARRRCGGATRIR